MQPATTLRTIAFALAILGLGSASWAASITLYVAPQGNDAWSGQRPGIQAPDGPFATLTRARDELRKLKAAGKLSQRATVVVMPGSYRLAEPFALTAEDSGTEAAPIVYQAQTTGQAVLTGGKPLSGFTPYRGKILKCDLKANGLAGKTFRQIFFKGKRQILARYPNFDPADPHGGKWAHVAAVDGADNHKEFTYGEDEQHPWAHPDEATVPIFGGYDWAFNINRIAKHIPKLRKIVLKGHTWGPLRVGDRYFVEGMFEDLDAPGEWYLDPRTDTLYFWPPEPVADRDVVAPVADHVVSMDGAEHVELRGFVIEACKGTAVELKDCRGCRVSACTVRNAGGWGINIAGGDHTGAQGNNVSWCGHGGIIIRGGDRKTLARGENFADDNYIHHCARIWLTYRPGVSVGGVGNRVSHNLIHDMPHAGLLLGGNENVVEFNVVHHVNLLSADTGGIYFCSRDWTQRGNVIRYNIFHHCGGFGKANSWAPVSQGKVEFVYPHFTWGIYLDDPTTGTLVYGNILYNVPNCGLHNHGGRDNTFENNILIDCPALGAGQLSPNWKCWVDIFKKLKAARYPGSPYLKLYPQIANIADTHPEEMSGLRFIHNIVYCTVEGTAWLRSERGRAWVGERGQQLYRLGMRPYDFERNEWDYNCIYMEPGIEPRISLTLKPEPNKKLSWDEWRALGADAHSVLADPLFVDAKNNDYRLKPDSPALRLGFKPIPVDKIGMYADARRATWPVTEAPGAAALGDFHTKRYYEPPQYRRLPAEPFAARDGLGNFFAKATEGKALKVAYFGGGIHPPNGWRKDVMAWLRKHCGKVQEINASICDCVRGSGFSVYRFRHDVLDKQPDLIFIDFASADHRTSPDAIMRVAEGLLRQAWTADPNVDVVFLYALRDGMDKDYAEGLAPYSVSAYERVAKHYRAASINMGCEVARRVREGKMLVKPAERAAKSETPIFSKDGVRPQPAGNKAYADAIVAALDEMSKQTTAAPHRLHAPYVADNYERAKLAPITKDMLTGEWKQLPADDPLSKRFARHFDAIWFTNSPGAKLTFKFKGTSASIFDLMGPDTGRVKVTVDGRVMGVRRQVDPWAYFQRLAAIPIASGLEDKEHSVTLELLPEPPARRVPIEAAKRLKRYKAEDFQGVALRFGWIRLMGEIAE